MNEPDIKALTNFAVDTIQAMWDGGVDGCDIQELAVKYGLIIPTTATEADSEAFDHVAPGDDCFRFADWLREPGKKPDTCATCEHFDRIKWTLIRGYCKADAAGYLQVDAAYHCEKFKAGGVA